MLPGNKNDANLSPRRVVVVGGGIAGLSAAYYLVKQAQDRHLPLHLTVLEAAPTWGGKIATERVDGFVIEGGPDTFLATKPWGVALCRELGLQSRLHGTNPHQKNTYVLNNHRLQPLPDGLAMMIPTRFAPMVRTNLLSWPQKARMGLDYLIPAAVRNGDESLGAFVSRRLGRAAYERLIEPLMSGIYAGDGDRLSLQATFPILRELEIEHGGLVRGALSLRRKAAKIKQAAAGSRSAFLTPTTGLAEIVEALLASLVSSGADLRLASAAQCIERLQGGQLQVSLENGDVLTAEQVIVAAPAYAAAALLQELNPELAAELAAIEYVTTATVSLAYSQADLPRPLDGYGYVIPRREGRQALACTWTSTKFPHRAPEGYSLLRVFIGRAGQETQITWDEAGLLQMARDELRHTLGITAEPVLARVVRWDQAMPQYNLGHPVRLERISAALSHTPGLALAGNGYSGIGIPDCIHSGEMAALKVIDSL